MHLSCQSSVAKTCCRIPMFFLAAFLLTTWLMAQPTDGRPLERQRRAIISSVLTSTSTDSLTNPCETTQPASGSGAASDCDTQTSLHRRAQLAVASLQKLQTELDSTPHSNLDLTPAISQPVLNGDMTRSQRLREIYRSLVHHAAHLHVTKKQATNHTEAYDSVLGSIKLVQCALKCIADVSSAEMDADARAALNLDAYEYESDSHRTLRDIAIAQHTIALLNTLIAEVGA